jgi:hypothetical protein
MHEWEPVVYLQSSLSSLQWKRFPSQWIFSPKHTARFELIFHSGNLFSFSPAGLRYIRTHLAICLFVRWLFKNVSHSWNIGPSVQPWGTRNLLGHFIVRCIKAFQVLSKLYKRIIVGQSVRSELLITLTIRFICRWKRKEKDMKWAVKIVTIIVSNFDSETFFQLCLFRSCGSLDVT